MAGLGQAGEHGQGKPSDPLCHGGKGIGRDRQLSGNATGDELLTIRIAAALPPHPNLSSVIQNVMSK